MSTYTTSFIDVDNSALFTLEPLASSKNTLVEDDRRFNSRIPRAISVRLLAAGRGEGPCCTLTDISEGGARVKLPVSSGLSVGQRLEVLLANSANANDLVEHLSGGCFATIVRTERCESGKPEWLEAGLRFDQPLML
jgi:hypothetical protein